MHIQESIKITLNPLGFLARTFHYQCTTKKVEFYHNGKVKLALKYPSVC